MSSPLRFAFIPALVAWSAAAATPPLSTVVDGFKPVDTQTSGRPLDPQAAVSRMQVPAGFKITLAAAEPAVRQPIAITFDDRGRLWVAESYSYDGSDFTDKHEDRILIFEDKDGDGVFDSRRVFASNLNRLTGLVWGFKGAWVLTPPTLSFIPDADGDDQPDGETIIQLDGWTLEAEHNSVNGLSWGPDGWLYGRHGNKEASHPGRPGQPASERPLVSCAIWRFHPTRRVFEVVVDGTVNPWGHDWDELGQLFMSTSVMEHLWHVVPGSHFRRNANVPVQEHVYELMGPTSDHSHRPRKASSGASAADDGGGGHSHVGTMIYLGDRWPDTYRGRVFLNNVMGRRINQERLSRVTGTDAIRATHEPDFLLANDPWFRGVSLEYGPDGDVMVTDWSDNGECHDRDGVSRSTGRIYKISWGEPRRVEVALGRATDAELVALQWHRNDWFVRHARRLLQERAHAGAPMSAVHQSLKRAFQSESSPPVKLRALWALYVTGGADVASLESILRDPADSVRYWAIRLLVDNPATAQRVGPVLIQAAEKDVSWLGRMALASALPPLDAESRWRLGKVLAMSAREEDDPNLRRLIWSGWGVEVETRPREALELAGRMHVSSLRQWTVRRVAETQKDLSTFASLFMDALGQSTSSVNEAIDLMTGAEAGLKRGAGIDAGRLSALASFYESTDSGARRAALRLGGRFGDDTALRRLCDEAADRRAPVEWRRQALQSLAAAKPGWLASRLLELLTQPEIAEPVIRAMGVLDDPVIAPALVMHYAEFNRPARAAVIDGLIARPATALVLVEAVRSGGIPKAELSRVQVRQLAALKSPALQTEVERLFGRMNESSETATTRIRKLRYTLKDPAYMATANRQAGQGLFAQRCATCHTLFGEGGKLAPDLTGSGRKDLEYLLTNVIDPNASIAAEWRLVVATLTDGEMVAGSLAAEHAESVVLVTPTGPRTIERARIRTLERSNASLMPTGLTDDLTVDQVRDLFGFLMSDAGSGPP